MADRNMRFPAQGQGYGMMQGTPQFVQPGMQQFPTMHQQRMMPQGQPMMSQGQPMMSHGQRMVPPGMYPVNMMGMRMGPTGAPPAYNKQMQDNFHNRKKEVATGSRGAGKTEEQLRKERQYQQQRDKLKQFGKPTSGGLDPNKLVDSIFGTSDKPKSKPKNIKIPTEEDNSFGEFMSSPPSSQTEQLGTNFPLANQTNGSNSTANPSSTDPVTVTAGSSRNPSLQQTELSPPKPDKKDLEKMMFECSDLKAPQKAKLFHKPALKELHPTHHHTQVPAHHDSQNARKWNQQWNQSEELSELFIQEAVKDIQTMPKKPVPKHTSPTSKHPPKPPPWLTDETLQPEIYKHVLEASLVDGQISTERLYPILMLGGLPKDLMGYIWSMCNKHTPGQLIRTELYQILALIALAQNNYQVTNLDILYRCPQPPVPRLQQQGPPATVPQGPPAGPQGISQGVPQGLQGPPANIPQGPLAGLQGFPQGAPQGLQVTGQGQLAPQQGMPVSAQAVPQSPPVVQQGTIPLGPQVAQQVAPASVQSPQGPTPVVQGVQGQGPPTMQHVVSAPATLHVTQLPPAGVPQGMMGVTAMTTEEDDFADFQAAPPTSTPTIPHAISQPAIPQQTGSFGDLMSDVKNDNRSPLKDQAKYLYSVPTPDDAAIAATLSPQDLQTSNVENFFGSDDSSEGVGSHNSLDDEYFDGYKSADSKRSDSTSQFSTDQSESEDFKNFENYLDEFQKKKEQKEKESPFHKAAIISSNKKEIGSPSKVFPKVIPQKLPEPGKQNQSTSVSLGKQIQVTSQAPAAADDFADFADFQSAPVTETKQTLGESIKSGLSSDQVKKSLSKAELIGDEDKYAALRVLDFSSPSNSDTNDLMGEASVFSNTEENWADFQNASSNDDQTNTDTLQQNLKPENTESAMADSGWADFESALVPNNDGLSSLPLTDLSVPASIPVSMTMTQTALNNNSSPVSVNFGGQSSEPVSDDWADFQGENGGEFSEFQSSTSDFTTSKNDEEEKPSGLVSVKKAELGKADILGLFKVKDTPVSVVKSRDDDINVFEPTEKKTNDSTERKNKLINKPFSPKRKAFSAPRLSSDGDDFMAPPPLDHFHDDEHDDYASYSRGYDFDDMMMPPKKDDKEHKHIYGVYGLNQNFVVSGHKKDNKTVHLEKDQTEDDDNDSVSSKDNDIMRPRFGVGKDFGEDSQSVSSLDFVVSKRMQNLKESDAESADAHSVSSFEFGNKDILPESKSLDSLDLRAGEVNDSGSQGSSDKEKDSLDKEPVDDMVLADLERIPTPDSGLPVIGDRYSNILHDIPGSDKHAYEWQRCLDNCCRMIKDANNIFNSVSSSAVCNEIIKSGQGSEYIQGIIEIYRVVCKITISMKKAAIHTDKLKDLLKDIDLAWNNLTAFLVGGSIMPDSKSLDFSHGFLMSDDTTAQYLACGVCLLSVDMKMKGGGQENGNSVAKLTYGGRQYHSACANLWINCVDSTLPALKLPELL